MGPGDLADAPPECLPFVGVFVLCVLLDQLVDLPLFALGSFVWGPDAFPFVLRNGSRYGSR